MKSLEYNHTELCGLWMYYKLPHAIVTIGSNIKICFCHDALMRREKEMN